MPTAVQIGPMRYSIEQDKAKLNAYCLEQTGAYCGYCDHQNLEIVVDPKSAVAKQRETLTHELLHALLAASSIGHDLPNNEPFVAKFAPWLLDTLQRNPEVVAYLTDVEST
jgi:hypothetical protein